MTNRLFKALNCDECPRNLLMVGNGEEDIKGQLVETGWDVAEDRDRLTCPRSVERLSKER